MVIAVSELHELHKISMIHYILDNALFKWVGNTAHILAFFKILLPGSIMRSGHHTSPFFTILKTLFFPVRLTFIVTLIGL